MLVHFLALLAEFQLPACAQCDERKYIEPLLIGYWNRKGRFNNLEQRVGEAEVVATEKSMREAMNEEVCLTLDVHEHHVWSDIGKDYSWWKNLSEEAHVIPENMPRLTVSFDMGWQQRSSGNKYNSNSGHAFRIGGYSKKILDYRYCVKSKVCNTCDYAARRFTSAEPHERPKNHQLGSSKSMEPDAGVEMVIKVVNNYQVFYTTMICDDDSTKELTANELIRIYNFKIHCMNGQKRTMAQKRQTMDASHYKSKNRFFNQIPLTEFAYYYAPASCCLEAQNPM